jgi:hypothetical protein
MTAEEFVALIGEVQNNVAATLKLAVPKAKSFNRWVMDSNREEWAEKFRSDDDLDSDGEKRIHAVTVAFAGSALPELENQSLQAIGPVITFAVDFWLEYDVGSDHSNSEMIMRAEILFGQLRLWKASDLGLREIVLGHQQLQMPPDLDVVPLGGKLVHHAPGSINVLMQSKVITFS